MRTVRIVRARSARISIPSDDLHLTNEHQQVHMLDSRVTARNVSAKTVIDTCLKSLS